MYVLELENIDRRYGRNTILNGLSLHVPESKIYGFLGRNGAGKTTTIRIILGLIRFHGGTIKIRGKAHASSDYSVPTRIGSIVEFPGFYPNLDGGENLQAHQWLLGKNDGKSIDRVLSLVGLASAGRKKVGAYSLGMKQRLGIARALLNDPDMLILDEPTNGLDPSGIHEMRNLLKSLSTEHGKTVFVSSHLLSEIEQIVDLVGIIKSGRMVEEISISDLACRCRQGLRLRTDRPQEAIALLQRAGDIDGRYIPEEDLVVIPQNDQPAAVNRLLVENGLNVSMIAESSRTLESYFLDITRPQGEA